MKKEIEKPDLEIFELNANRLDKEWIDQPKIFYSYAEKLANARDKLERKKARLDVIYAETDKAIRESPKDYGIEKVTEPVVANCVLLQDRYAEALTILNRTKHEVNICAAVVEALDHRKKALENLVSLHGQNYFAPPQAPSNSNIHEMVKDNVRKRGRP